MCSVHAVTDTISVYTDKHKTHKLTLARGVLQNNTLVLFFDFFLGFALPT